MKIIQYTDPETFVTSDIEYDEEQYRIAEDIRDRMNSQFPVVPGKDGKLYVLASIPPKKIRVTVEVLHD